MDRSRATYFTQDEQVIIMQGYEELKDTITARSNTVAANKAREGCWQKIADRVNACGSSSRTWQQVRAKYKNIIQSANRKKNELRKTGGGPAPQVFTVPEELALSNNEGRPIMEGIQGGFRSDPSAGDSEDNLFVHVVGDTMVLLPPGQFPCSTPQVEMDDQDTLSVLSERPEEDDLHPVPRASTSASGQGRERTTTDTLRAVYKRNLELDNIKKELEIKKLKLEIELLELKKKQMQTPQ